MLRAMRSLALLTISLSLVAACGKKDSGPRKLKKTDYKVFVDEKGRMMPEIELFDDKHDAIVVLGSYTLTLSRPDGTVLCSLTRTLAKEDYNEKKRLKAEWQDASCPPDPAAEELRIALEVKTGDKPDAPKITRDKTTPTKFVYRHLQGTKPAGDKPADKVDATKLPAEAPLPEPPPATGSGSAAGSGSADAKAVDTKPAEADKAKGSGSAK
jgi:hypothetical protein